MHILHNAIICDRFKADSYFRELFCNKFAVNCLSSWNIFNFCKPFNANFCFWCHNSHLCIVWTRLYLKYMQCYTREWFSSNIQLLLVLLATIKYKLIWIPASTTFKYLKIKNSQRKLKCFTFVDLLTNNPWPCFCSRFLSQNLDILEAVVTLHLISKSLSNMTIWGRKLWILTHVL